MLMPKSITHKIFEHLFEQGVMTAKKDVRPTTIHPDVNVLNLYVIKTLQSLKSRGYVREQFAWRSYYWFLTNDGITFLREALHLPAEIVPATLKRQQRQDTARGARPDMAGGESGGGGMAAQDGRTAYRRGQVPAGGEAAGAKEAGMGGPGVEMHFSGGFGRGRGGGGHMQQ